MLLKADDYDVEKENVSNNRKAPIPSSLRLQLERIGIETVSKVAATSRQSLKPGDGRTFI